MFILSRRDVSERHASVSEPLGQAKRLAQAMTAGVGIFISLIVLTGCMSTSEVVSVGKDTYMLMARGSGLLTSSAEVPIEAMKAANVHCASLGRRMIIRRTDTQGTPGLTDMSSSLVFSCVTEDDPEYKRPDLQKDPNVIIQDNRSKP